MTDAIQMVNRIGAAPKTDAGHTQIHDFNGDQFIDQSEVMNVVHRIGLTINNSVF